MWTIPIETMSYCKNSETFVALPATAITYFNIFTFTIFTMRDYFVVMCVYSYVK